MSGPKLGRPRKKKQTKIEKKQEYQDKEINHIFVVLVLFPLICNEEAFLPGFGGVFRIELFYVVENLSILLHLGEYRCIKYTDLYEYFG